MECTKIGCDQASSIPDAMWAVTFGATTAVRFGIDATRPEVFGLAAAVRFGVELTVGVTLCTADTFGDERLEDNIPIISKQQEQKYTRRT
mmetsp:Transcript_12440/g.20392  ORF Transcript_12440/g.20392 Transcript_12440/m.20392 type:complete len:90 (-) Transcript_12440:2-271(-)